MEIIATEPTVYHGHASWEGLTSACVKRESRCEPPRPPSCRRGGESGLRRGNRDDWKPTPVPHLRHPLVAWPTICCLLLVVTTPPTALPRRRHHAADDDSVACTRRSPCVVFRGGPRHCPWTPGAGGGKISSYKMRRIYGRDERHEARALLQVPGTGERLHPCGQQRGNGADAHG